MLVIGIILVVVGAIISFGIDTVVDGVDLKTIGLILMAGGVLAIIGAAIRGAGWRTMTNSKMRSERHVSPDGKHVVEETDIR